MTSDDIFKRDNILIGISYFLIVPLLLIGAPWLSNFGEAEDLTVFFRWGPVYLGTRWTFFVLLFMGALFFQILGRIMRIREKRSITILESIPCFQSITLSQLSMDTGFSLPQVESLVKGLAAKPSLGIVLNGHSVSRATEIPPKPGKRPKPETGSFKRSVKKDRSLGKDRVKITTSATLNGKEIDPDDLPDEIKKMLGKTDFSNFRGDNFTGETVTMQTSTFSMNINGREINGEELTPELKAQIDDPALSLMEKARILEEHFGDKK